MSEYYCNTLGPKQWETDELSEYTSTGMKGALVSNDH